MNPFFHAILAQIDEVINVTPIGDTLAYTWFGRSNYAYSEEAQKYWIGSTRDTPNGTTQHITQFDIETQTYTTTQVGTVFQKDDHNQAQILIRESDKRLIAFYVEHNGLRLRWKISTNPLDSTSWGSEINTNPVAKYSYISPYQSSNGYIYIFFRAYVDAQTAYLWYYMKSTDGGLTFGSAVEFFNNGTVQPYLITVQDGDKIHFTASNGHPQTNISLNINPYHFYFDLTNDTFYNSTGTALSLPLTANSISLIHGFSGNDSSWILDISTKNGLPRVLYAVYPSGRNTSFQVKELYYSEWNGSSWTTGVKISETMVGYIEDDVSIQELCYTGASRFDTANPDVIWMPKQVNGILEIHKVDLSESPIYIEQLTYNSEVNNWRPISVPSGVNNLLWLKNNDYNMFTDYDITLQAKTVQV